MRCNWVAQSAPPPGPPLLPPPPTRRPPRLPTPLCGCSISGGQGSVNPLVHLVVGVRHLWMSKEEALKIQTCLLKVNIHCDGCQKKVKKILHKTEGVYQTRIDPEQGKVTVSGTVDPATIIKKSNQAGKPAELWGSKAGVANPFQKLHLDGSGKGLPKDAGCKGHSKDAGGQGQKGGGGGGGSKDAKMLLPQLTLQHLQQLQQQMQMKGLKLPQFMHAKMPFAAAASLKDPKSVKFKLLEDDFGEDGGNEFDDDEDFDDIDDDFYDEVHGHATKLQWGRQEGW